jgi:glycerol uptake facilitator-like aquaporin
VAPVTVVVVVAQVLAAVAGASLVVVVIQDSSAKTDEESLPGGLLWSDCGLLVVLKSLKPRVKAFLAGLERNWICVICGRIWG